MAPEADNLLNWVTFMRKFGLTTESSGPGCDPASAREFKKMKIRIYPNCELSDIVPKSCGPLRRAEALISLSRMAWWSIAFGLFDDCCCRSVEEEMLMRVILNPPASKVSFSDVTSFGIKQSTAFAIRWWCLIWNSHQDCATLRIRTLQNRER